MPRIASFGYILTGTVFQSKRICLIYIHIPNVLTSPLVAPLGDCQKLGKAIGWTGAFAVPLNCLLFFFRVRAVYRNSLAVTVFFGTLCLATLACCMTAPFGFSAAHIGSTRFCTDKEVKSYTSSGFVAATVHDTLIFIAISWRLVSVSFAGTRSARMKSFFRGQYIGPVSRVLLQTGQLYYLYVPLQSYYVGLIIHSSYSITIGMNIATMVIIFTPSVPPIIRAMFTMPNVALQNIMSCRVYRLLKLGYVRDEIGSYSQESGIVRCPHTFQYEDDVVGTRGKPDVVTESNTSTAFTLHSVSQKSKTLPMNIQITQGVEVHLEGGKLDSNIEYLGKGDDM